MLSLFDEKPDSKTELKEICQWLDTQSKEDLLKMILTQALSNEKFFRNLSLQAAKNVDVDQFDILTYKKAIDQTVFIDDYMDYNGVFSYASDVDEVILLG